MHSRRNVVLAAGLAAIIAAGPLAAPAAALEPLTIGTSSLKDASLRLYGFVETDNIYDTTQSYSEEQDSVAPVTRNKATGASGATGATNIGGTRGRDQMSVRNSRLGLELNVPAQDNGIKGKAVFEMDFLGNSAVNTAPGSVPGSQTERDYYNNPSMRVRHAFVEVSKDDLSAKLGQYWSLLGWQPYYFPGEAVILPGVGQLYRRFAQARVTDTHSFGDWTLESAADAAKPAEMNSGSPEWHAGLRLASTKYTGASIAGSGTSMVGEVALDVLVPIIPSSDGMSRDNTLVWAAEGVEGSGVGGLEMAGLTFGVPGVTAAGSNAGAAIDSGIAGEVNQTKATFNDPNNRFARNNRYQMSAYFMF